MSFIFPVDKKDSYIHSGYGIFRQQFNGIHYGIDIAKGSLGNNIYAVDNGKIIWSNYNLSGYGNAIVIQHSNGKSTLYAHMQNISPYKYGDYVKQGMVIGNVGNTGRSTGSHLHFEVLSEEAGKIIEEQGKINSSKIGKIKHDYKLDPTGFLPEDKENPDNYAKERNSKFFTWHCEGDKSCEKCKERDDKVYEYGVDIEPPLHPNCDCTVKDYFLDDIQEQKFYKIKSFEKYFNKNLSCFEDYVLCSKINIKSKIKFVKKIRQNIIK